MSKIIKRYETKLETASAENIGAILDAKLEATSPEQTVDYVAFAIDNLNSQLDKIKDAEAELKLLKSDLNTQISMIKHGTSAWLSECGVDSLKGLTVSSIKATTPKPKEDLKVTSEESLINQGFFKTTLDKTAVKNAIKNGVEIDGAEIEITHLEQSLTIYKKRK